MGRMATYTGQRITWEQAMESQLELKPEAYDFGEVNVNALVIRVAGGDRALLDHIYFARRADDFQLLLRKP